MKLIVIHIDLMNCPPNPSLQAGEGLFCENCFLARNLPTCYACKAEITGEGKNVLSLPPFPIYFIYLYSFLLANNHTPYTGSFTKIICRWSENGKRSRRAPHLAQKVSHLQRLLPAGNLLAFFLSFFSTAF